MFSQRLRPASSEPGVLMSSTRDTRGSTAEMSIAPEVSSDTAYPASHSRCSRPMQRFCDSGSPRSEEHTSELQSLMRISYAVFCLKKKKQTMKHTQLDVRKMKMNTSY